MKTTSLLSLGVIAITFALTGCKDDCDSVVCYNGGVCIDGTCDCPPGVFGINCESTDECFGITCQNGGDCINGVCDCTLGYTGPDCSEFDQSIEICINSITVSGYPVLTSTGAPWDDPIAGSATGPDVTFYIINPNGADHITTWYVPNANGQNLNFSNGFPFCLNGISWDNDIDFLLYDLDDIDGSDAFSDDDFMTGFSLNLWERLVSSGYPGVYTVNSSNSNLSMTFNVSYDN